MQLLAEGLCAKHDLELSEYATHTEMVLDDREDGREHMTPQTSGEHHHNENYNDYDQC